MVIEIPGRLHCKLHEFPTLFVALINNNFLCLLNFLLLNSINFALFLICFLRNCFGCFSCRLLEMRHLLFFTLMMTSILLVSRIAAFNEEYFNSCCETCRRVYGEGQPRATGRCYMACRQKARLMHPSPNQSPGGQEHV